MDNELITQNLPLTGSDIEVFKENRKTLINFVKSQMIEGIDNDYGVIPGTKKKSLFKPGAQKLRMIYGLGVRVKLAFKEVDLHANFAMFGFGAEVYHLKSNIVVASCVGSTNSREKKWKERTVWKKTPQGQPNEQYVEATPIGDVLNTLMKMAQKRAIVGATIEATGATDIFTQDMDDEDERVQNGHQAAKPKEEVSGDAPVCCNKNMLPSKFGNDWWCTICKTKKPRG